ncbi:hypothetical protein CBI38_21690 [Rhodococcus oxybenzonivorans]|uniref:Uncharacterized protein n=1 Tax=Rhodococcus oxybenzonivorans TaxID=1990687 RepID=A0A2S2BYX6_9NOCA|nr:hypothetical protein CBI38_21690 [Rhodococcus oxybenzonivorans]
MVRCCGYSMSGALFSCAEQETVRPARTPCRGAIRRSGIVGYTPRRLHADGSGCWIVGADGIAHCDHAGTVTIVDSAPSRRRHRHRH